MDVIIYNNGCPLIKLYDEGEGDKIMKKNVFMLSRQLGNIIVIFIKILKVHIF